MYPIKQSTAITIPFFLHDGSGDAVTGKVDGDFTKRISKNGGAFAAMTVTISEMENGWYSITLSTGHTDTLGVLSLTFTATGAKQVNLQYRVSATIFDDLAQPGDAMDLVADAVDSVSVADTATAEIADRILGRSLAGGADGGRIVADALRALRNRVARVGGTMTVYQENDTTSAWTATVTTAAGDPITEVDPA